MYSFNSKNGELIDILPSETTSAIVGTTISSSHIIVAHRSGTLWWYPLSPTINGPLPLPAPVQTANINDGTMDARNIAQLHPHTDFAAITVICTDNTLHDVQFEVDEAVVEIEDPDALPDGLGFPPQTNEPVIPAIEEQGFSQTTDNHTGLATSVISLILAGKNPVGLVVTCGSDGRAMLWKDTASPVLLGSWLVSNGSAIVSSVALDGFPCLAVGTADGVVRILHVQGRGSIDSSGGEVKVTCVFRAKLTASSITTMCWEKGTMKLAVGCYGESTEEGGSTGFIINVDPSKSIGVVATVAIKVGHPIVR